MQPRRKCRYLIGVILSIALALAVSNPTFAAEDHGNGPPPPPPSGITG